MESQRSFLRSKTALNNDVPEKRLKVLVLTNVPSPYFVDFLNELGKYCELTVLFEKKTSSKRDKSWLDYKFTRFKGIIMKGVCVSDAAAFCPGVRKYIKKGKFDRVIVTDMSTPTGIYAIHLLKRRKIPFILQSEGGFAKSGKGFKEKFKKRLMSGAQAYFSTAKLGDEYFLQYGAVPEKLRKFIFTSLYEREVLKSTVTAEEKGAYREKLGITEQKVILAIGQFIHRKGFDVLLRAAEHVDPDCGIYFVGGVPTKEYLQLKESLGLCRVHFIGFKSKVDILDYYRAADLFVLPTREDTWGLVVCEAMAQGLPVVTTTRCVAGTELVKDGENGFLVEPDDADALAEVIGKIMRDDGLRKSMSEKSLDTARAYTQENAALRHIELLNELS